MEKVSNTELKGEYKIKKESSSWAWSKCFHHGSGRVTCMRNAQEWNNVDLSNLFIGHKFSQGAYSKLHHGIYKEEPVAVKIVSVPEDEAMGTLASKLKTQFIREVTFLSHLHHQNVIKFIGACKDTNVYCILTEYLNNGSLRAYLNKLESKPICMKKVIAFALDIARGMEYVHAQGIIHRDLKPENVLVDGDLHLKIADFGASCEASKCDNSLSGTYRWMAPEMIKGKRYGRKVDVYSFGLILWEMVSGKIPFEDITPIQVAVAVRNKDLRPVIPSTCPPVIRNLIQQCWASKPEKRPEFCKIVQALEQFDQSLLAIDGTLNLMQKPCSQDHRHLKKDFLHWIQKIGHVH